MESIHLTWNSFALQCGTTVTILDCNVKQRIMHMSEAIMRDAALFLRIRLLGHCGISTVT